MNIEQGTTYDAWWNRVYSLMLDLMAEHTTAQLRKKAHAQHIYKPDRNPHTAKEYYARRLALEQLRSERPY